ncbi:MAG: DUF3037 domain-containing protein [Pseudomonadota bacterium]
MTQFDYFILRAIPDRIRGECLNVGLVVFVGETAKVLVSVEGWRLRALNPDLGSINTQAWANELEGQLATLPSKDARIFFLSAINGPITVDDASGLVTGSSDEECMRLIQGLLHRLVDTPLRTLKAVRENDTRPKSKLNAQLRGWFRTAQVFSPKVTDLSNGKIVSGYPIVASDDLYADFAWRNGSVHVLEAMDLRGVEKITKALRGEAGWKAILLDQARKTLSEDSKRIAVISADDYAIVKPLIGMIERYSDDVIAMESSTDRQRLADFVSRSLHLEKSLDPAFQLTGSSAH